VMTAILEIGRSTAYRYRLPRHINVSGVTLVELLVALVVMTLLIAAMPLAVDRLVPARRFKAVGDKLILDLRRAQLSAISSATPVVITLRESGYAVGTSATSITWPPNYRVTYTSSLDSQSLNAVTFFPDGSVVGGELRLENDKRQLAIIVDGLTGRIRRSS
jgi:Tfp pilus assembly protein FimT